jgi:endonuclease/exonuclease/phosphatase (EEP) superfamily protein YafD
VVLIAVGIAATAVPFIESNAWWIRSFDFPRLQLAIGLAALLVALLALRPRLGPVGWTAAALAVLAVSYHAYKLYPYAGIAGRGAASLQTCPDERTLTVMVANVQRDNEHADAFLRLVRQADPDLLLVMETDPWWDRHLAPLDADYPHTLQHIPPRQGDFGMHLMAKIRLIAPEFRFFFGAATPTVFADVELRSGDVVRFVGVHPHPPLAWSQPSTLRDASLLTAALEARSAAAPTIVAGDFNAVPWETITLRAARIGELLDPRLGRGLYPTFSAKSLLMSWPLDQVLYQDAFGLLGLEVLPAFGSDHFPVVARLCYAPGDALPQAAPPLEPDDLSQAAASIEAARAMDVVEQVKDRP